MKARGENWMKKKNNSTERATRENNGKEDRNDCNEREALKRRVSSKNNFNEREKREKNEKRQK